MPPRVEYEITPLGRSLAPVFAALSEWSVHLPEVEQARRDHEVNAGRSRAQSSMP
jgi:DNA-binding HxlR family transcriptional regulator